MKTILVPTDLSEIADNAVNYAVEISRYNKAKIILFHVYHMPVVTPEVPVVMPVFEELEKNSMEALKKVKDRVNSHSDYKMDIECVCRFGLATDEISAYVEENKIDLLVLGMQGAGYLSERLIGSVSTALMRQVKCPLLIIHKDAKFKPVKKIVLACDYKDGQNKNVFEPLKEITKLFNAQVHIVHIAREPAEVIPTTQQAAMGINLEHSLEGIEHTFHYSENKDVVQGINAYVEENNMDMVVMIPRIHTVFSKMFHEPETKRMAFHSKVPLLILNS